MDPLGVLAASTALVAYPGAAFVAGPVWLLVTAEGRAAARLRPEVIAAAVCALLACTLSPLPGSPSLVLPDRSGAPANLLASLLLLGAAVGLAAPPRWRAWPAAAALAALVAPLVLGAAEATFDVAALAALPGRDLGGARICAALAMLVAVPSLVPTAQDGPSATAWALVIAATAVVAAGLALPAPTAGLPAALTAGIVLAAVGVYALLVARLGRRVPAPAAALVTVALGALSVALSIVAEVG